MRLVHELDAEIGEQISGSRAAERASEAIAAAFRDVGLEPRFQEFDFVGYDPDEPELEIAGERWGAGLCIGTNIWAKRRLQDAVDLAVALVESQPERPGPRQGD